MNNRKYGFLIALSVIAGFTGGIFATQLLPAPVHAANGRILTVEGLRIIDKSGVLRGEFKTENGLVKIALIGKSEADQLGIFVDDSGTQGIAFATDDKVRLSVSFLDNEPEFALYDETGSRKGTFYINTKGEAGISLNNKNNTSGIRLASISDQSALFISDGKGKLRAGISGAVNGQSEVALYNQTGLKKVSLETNNNESELQFFYRDGTPSLKMTNA